MAQLMVQENFQWCTPQNTALRAQPGIILGTCQTGAVASHKRKMAQELMMPKASVAHRPVGLSIDLSQLNCHIKFQ